MSVKKSSKIRNKLFNFYFLFFRMCSSLVIFILLQNLIVHGTNAAKILVVQPIYFNFLGHFGFTLNLAKFLAEENGHEVHMLIPLADAKFKLSDKKVEAQLNVRYFFPKNPSASTFIYLAGFPIDRIYLEIADDVQLMDELRAQKFDVGITEGFQMNFYALAILHILAIPATICTHSQSLAPIQLYIFGVLSKMKNEMHDYIGIPTANLGEVVDIELLNFKSKNEREQQLKLRRGKVWQKCVEQTMACVEQFINEDVHYQKLAKEKYGINLLSMYEMLRRVNVFLVNTMPEVDFAQHKILEGIEKVKFIGGFHLGRAFSFNIKATQQANSLIDSMLGTKVGVVLVSFGTVVESLRPISSDVVEALLETMERFSNYLFIWKTSELPVFKQFKMDNVITQDWINQRELLAHPKTMAFVSHCGMNSVMEGTFYGVPLVCMPFRYDQYYNAEVLAMQHIGLVVDYTQDKDTIQAELNSGLSEALELTKINDPENSFDLNKFKKTSEGIRQKNLVKLISDTLKSIEMEMEKKN